jgi:haloalkane dehalogenase
VEVLRTPDARFEQLPGYSFAPHYVDVPSGDGAPPSSLRVHFVDEGPAGADETVVCLHGEPSWAFLYRTVLPVLVAAGHRVVVLDLVGFGRSDKPAARAEHTYARHVAWTGAALFDELGLEGVTLVGQDWGGLIGLRLVAERPERFRRVVVANTGLPTGDAPMSDAFVRWQRFSQQVSELPVGRIVAGGTTKGISDAVAAAYDAPFPDERYKEGPRQLPALVPTSPDDPASEDNRRAWASLRAFDRPFLCAFSDGDPITRGADRLFRESVPGARGVQHVTIEGAGHFLQEDQGERLGSVVAAFVAATS